MIMAVTVSVPAASAFASLVRSAAPSLSLPPPLAAWLLDLSGLTESAVAAPGAAAAAPLVSSAAATRVASVVRPRPLCCCDDKVEPLFG